MTVELHWWPCARPTLPLDLFRLNSVGEAMLTARLPRRLPTALATAEMALDWVTGKWQSGDSAYVQSPDANRLLDRATTSARYGAAEYTLILTQALNALRIPARRLRGLTEGSQAMHTMTEAWIDDLNGWIVLDGRNGATWRDGAGRPLSGLDVQRRYLAKDMPEFRGGGRNFRAGDAHRWFAFFAAVAVTDALAWSSGPYVPVMADGTVLHSSRLVDSDVYAEPDLTAISTSVTASQNAPVLVFRTEHPYSIGFTVTEATTADEPARTELEPNQPLPLTGDPGEHRLTVAARTPYGTLASHHLRYRLTPLTARLRTRQDNRPSGLESPLCRCNDQAMTTYDYVIVGAGSAGCVLAARLTEDPDVTVALIEAGGPDTDQEIHIPAAFSQQFKTRLDWDFDTDPEPGLGGRRAYLPRGKSLGGSSSMNAMIYMRGNPEDYDGWSRNGAAGWSWPEVLPYFLKAEDNERGADDFHGADGPLTVSDGRSNHALASAFVEAGVQAGYEHNRDFNGKSQFGVGTYQLTQRNGMRCSAAVAYLHPALGRPNLTLLPFALAQKVIITGNRATGVEVFHDGLTEVLDADREVILSAGAYLSPKLLQLSGVGPAALLTAFGIEVIQDLPAGENLQDHIATVLNYRTSTESLMTAATEQNAVLLMTEGRGPLTSNIGEAGGFFRSSPALNHPDLQFHMAPVLFHAEGMGAIAEHGLAFGPCVLTPTSRGSVTLRSLRPDAAPRIQHNYLSTQEDRDCLSVGIRIGLDIARQAALASVITGPFDIPADDDLYLWARRVSGTLYHPTSTCSIGPVVDPRLRVHGIDGLRVVDASVFPTVPRGNTNAPTIMTAEKAADMIKEEQG